MRVPRSQFPICPKLLESDMNLNMDQQKAVANGQPVAVSVAGTECVLIRKDVFLRLDPDYDTGPWTLEEMNLLADEAEEIISRGETQ